MTTFSTPISDLAADLIAAGTSRDVTIASLRHLEIAIARATAETTRDRDAAKHELNRKREGDAERKRRQRANVTGQAKSGKLGSYISKSKLNKDSKLEEENKDSPVTVMSRDVTPTLSDWPKDFEDQFWQAYPPDRRVEKKAALTKLAGVKKTGLAWKVLIEGVQRYAAKCRREGTEPRFIKHPTVWLNKGCWDDATSKPNGNQNGQEFGYHGTAGASAAMDATRGRSAPASNASAILAGMGNLAARIHQRAPSGARSGPLFDTDAAAGPAAERRPEGSAGTSRIVIDGEIVRNP